MKKETVQAKKPLGKMTDAIIKAAVIRNHGRLKNIADDLGCSRMAVWKRMQKNPLLKELQQECTVMDAFFTLSQIHSGVENNEPWAITLAMNYHNRFTFPKLNKEGESIFKLEIIE